jgi:prevent-host-death family protein
MSIHLMPASDLRKGLHAILDKLTRPIFVTQRGRVKAVLLDIDRYNALMDELEDLHDQCDPEMRRLAAEAHTAHQRGETVPFEEVLKENGL